MDEIVHRILRFDRFALDLTRGCLRSGERDLALRPKAFQVLRHLVENSGRLVAKEELQNTLWGNRRFPGTVHPPVASYVG
jgi:DNA-binding winged helix-turn-helix (wHTH) protein